MATPALPATRDSLVRAQLNLLGPHGAEYLQRQGMTFSAMSDVIANHPQLSRRVDSGALLSLDPGRVAATLADLYHKKHETLAGAAFPTEMLSALHGDEAHFVTTPHAQELKNWNVRLCEARDAVALQPTLRETPGPMGYRWRVWLRAALAATSLVAVQPQFMRGPQRVMAELLAAPAYLATGLLGAFGRRHWHRAESEFIARALEGQVDVHHREHRMLALGGADYTAMPGVAHAGAEKSVARLIAESHGRPIRPQYSRMAAARGLAGFFSHASLLAYGLQQSPHAWDALSASMSYAIMQDFDWQPIVLDRQHLDQAIAMRDAGYQILIAAGHASDLDTLTLIAATHPLKPRPVAKRELLRAGGFGSVAWFHPWRRKQWQRDGCLPTSILVDRMGDPKARERFVQETMAIIRDDSPLHRGASPAFFVPGTRLMPPAVGLGGFKTGIIDIAQAALAEGRKVAILPLIAEGQQRILSADYADVPRRGVRVGSRVVIQYGEPYDFTELQSEVQRRAREHMRINSDKERAKALAALMWERHARLSLPVQWFLHSHAF